MKIFNKIVDILSSICRVIAVVVLCAMMLITFVDVVLRLIFNGGFLFTVELSGMLLMIVIYFSLSPTQFTNNHLHVTMLVRLMPEKVRFFIWGLFELICCAICGYMGVQSLDICARHAAQNLTPVTVGIPQAPFEYAAVCALFLFSLTILLSAVKSFLAVFSKDYAEKMKDVITV